ncbi:MAG TPA: hypothetical protein VIZ68_00035 [Thermoplasmata archaeon]
MGGQPGPAPDLSKAEIVDYEPLSGEAVVKLKLKDGSIIEVKLIIMNILRAGNDPATGLPFYVVQSAPLVRLVESPKELRKLPNRPGGGDTKSLPGFA